MSEDKSGLRQISSRKSRIERLGILDAAISEEDKKRKKEQLQESFKSLLEKIDHYSSSQWYREQHKKIEELFHLAAKKEITSEIISFGGRFLEGLYKEEILQKEQEPYKSRFYEKLDQFKGFCEHNNGYPKHNEEILNYAYKAEKVKFYSVGSSLLSLYMSTIEMFSADSKIALDYCINDVYYDYEINELQKLSTVYYDAVTIGLNRELASLYQGRDVVGDSLPAHIKDNIDQLKQAFNERDVLLFNKSLGNLISEFKSSSDIPKLFQESGSKANKNKADDFIKERAKYILEAIDNGAKTQQDVTDYFNEKNIKTRRNKQFQQAAIGRLIRSAQEHNLLPNDLPFQKRPRGNEPS